MTGSKMSRALFDAVLRGDLAQVEKTLDAGADPNAIDEGKLGWRPLHTAIEAIGEKDAPFAVLRVLLDRGAQVDGWDRKREATPLLMAVFRSQPDSVRLLLARGAEPDVVGAEGDTPLLWAIVEDDHATIDILLAHGVGKSINRAGTIEGTTPLGAAAMRGRLDLVERLLASGADASVTDHDRDTAEERAQGELSQATGELAERLKRIIERLQVVTREAR